MVKVCHLTSAHPRYDTRIFLKECSSLLQAGYNVSLVVADGKGDEKRSEIAIFDAGASSGRFDRIRNAPDRVLKKALEINAKVYHLHDPELLTIALKLKKKGKIVVFDSHEDVPKQIRGKHYLNKFIKIVISNLFAWYEVYICRQIDAVIGATPSITQKFQKIRCYSVNINNFPLQNEFADPGRNYSEKRKQVCFIGGISRLRGIVNVIQAFRYVKSGARLILAGEFDEQKVRDEVTADPAWDSITELGQVERVTVKEILRTSVAGIVTFLPAPNHVDSQPNKMFEYMSAGIPVIASDFPNWKQVIEDNQCGLCVDANNAISIAKAIDYMIENPLEARRMGENGSRMVRTKYNWSYEERKLLDFYKKILIEESK